ncbi:fibroblast growth factor 23 [Spea bombifrons]|uniref:fibroblast growth factor 23 n=1 Tax=Spea bombifrons TaxID=233779 RepID=UPI00234B2192|nr:fibroblast growth factor 23 [Spea bombifrons]
MPKVSKKNWPAMVLFALSLLTRVKVTEGFPNSSPVINAGWGNPDRLMHLYTATEWNSFHLQINHDGSVNGSPHQTIYSALMIKSESAGRVVITGVKSGRYLCMDRYGNVFGSHFFSYDDCIFKHETLENRHDVYHSPKHNYLISLKKPKHIFRPGMDLPPYSQFLSMENKIPITRFITPEPVIRHTRSADDPEDIMRTLKKNINYSPPKNVQEVLSSAPQEPLRRNHNEKEDPEDPIRIIITRKTRPHVPLFHYQ